MKTYRNWNRTKGKWETVKAEVTIFGESRTDKSKYRPNVNALTGAEGASEIKGEFDFPDGKDDGTKHFLLRNKGLDITELQTRAEAIMNEAKDLSADINARIMAEARATVENSNGMENVAPRAE